MTPHVFPRLYDHVMRAAERGRLAAWRRALAGSATGHVVEIGAGTGLNFPHYRAGVRVVATDPDLAMLRRARERATRSQANVLLVAADAEALPFRADAFDGGVVGLALCTIRHPDGALAELRRVLRPGAPLRLLEHVRVDHPAVGRLQAWLTPLWRRVAGGCHLDRRTVACVRESGFELEAVDFALGGLVARINARTP